MSQDTKIIKRTQFTPQESDIKNIIPTQGKSKEEMRIFLFEFFGMALFAYGIICSQGSDEFLALFFFASVCLAGPFSGAHVNPAVTMAMLLSRRINFGQAVLYWLAQFTGALCGACCCYLILNEVDSPQVKSTEYSWILSDFSGEAFGTFTFILFILIQTDSETTLTPGGQPMTTYVLVALALYFSRGFTFHSGGCLNPGMAVSLQLFQSFQTGDRQRMEFLWVFVGGPLGGGFGASVFFELFYKKQIKRL
ncbi:unnamed protein product [Paramecium pentaurelia]|uniref:Aquaporin n=1 Tax=Paramecium pentaurelia TaxID=43138 RepID=A0A8S1XEQ1_9CILI|nr:unnamed protein product [Paramecium pentaurelia]CAD8199409.1 unnamed protein product [Paramecium pentaurelia]